MSMSTMPPCMKNTAQPMPNPLPISGQSSWSGGAAPDIREGSSHPRVVVIEFASLADAVACYESAGYQAAKDIRASVSDGNLVIVEGYTP